VAGLVRVGGGGGGVVDGGSNRSRLVALGSGLGGLACGVDRALLVWPNALLISGKGGGPF